MGNVPSGVEMVVTCVCSVGGPDGDSVCWRMTVLAGETKVFVVSVGGAACTVPPSVTNVKVFWLAAVGCDPSVVDVEEDDFLFNVFWYYAMNRVCCLNMSSMCCCAFHALSRMVRRVES